MANKPACKLTGADGNIFGLIGLASRVLKKAGMHDEATQMTGRCMQADSYDAALCIIMEYVEVE